MEKKKCQNAELLQTDCRLVQTDRTVSWSLEFASFFPLTYSQQQDH